MNLNRNLLVGLFIVGAMSHYDADEVIKYADIQYIAKALKKKNFEIKNGPAKMRANPRQYAKQLSVIQMNWHMHTKISDQAWANTIEKFPATNAITVTGLILALLRKEPQMFKYYGFNKKKIDKFQTAEGSEKRLMFSSLKVASSLLNLLDAEIAHYNYRESRRA